MGEALLLGPPWDLPSREPVHRDGETRTVLFDACPDPYALDAQWLGTCTSISDGSRPGALHGHFDHSEGLLKAVEPSVQPMATSRSRCMVHSGALRRTGPAAAQWLKALSAFLLAPLVLADAGDMLN